MSKYLRWRPALMVAFVPAKSATFEVAPKTKVQISQSSEGLRRQTILGFEAEGM